MTQIDLMSRTRAPLLADPRIGRQRGLVHVVDGDAGARALIANWLEAAGLEAMTYACVQDLVDLVSIARPQCLIIDVDALWATQSDDRACAWPLPTRLPIVVTAFQPDIAMAVMAMKTGAADFIEKPLSENKIVEVALGAVQADRGRVAREAGAELLRQRFAVLSMRERQVMALVTMGKMNKQVGAVLNLSEITVKAHRGSAMRKMKAPTFVDLVRMAETLADELASFRNGC